MEVVSICENCKNLMLKSMEPCRFCGFKRKNYGSAFVIFIVILMVLVLALTIFGMRNFEVPDADPDKQQDAKSAIQK
ncbi:hypothetical protein BKE30_14150 [Alkanindiges hydrocarboniclasticus]|uniref:Uncharacterized protein n=1 Tax=Alkanindiges hydrocarboniclasticus TaxID=1907941 RepID=A0A1S8CRA9_9GAMM|nr:hypothetical protein [Alkanindiges hydrocarboniclasticus]ONG37608.1 hypothetical protein BKE30_14150 [Alkanindiges hydrocarboniclasticus]